MTPSPPTTYTGPSPAPLVSRDTMTDPTTQLPSALRFLHSFSFQNNSSEPTLQDALNMPSWHTAGTKEASDSKPTVAGGGLGSLGDNTVSQLLGASMNGGGAEGAGPGGGGPIPANPFLATSQPSLGLPLDVLLGMTAGGSRGPSHAGSHGGSGSGDQGGLSSTPRLDMLIGRPSPFVDEHKVVSRDDIEKFLKEASSSQLNMVCG